MLVFAEAELASHRRKLGFAQGRAVDLAFGDGQAVIVGPDATGKEVVAVQDQVMGGDAGGEVSARA